jgi:hypothetical protein
MVRDFLFARGLESRPSFKSGRATDAGHINVCLCLSDVVKFVESNVVAQKAVKLLGDHAKVEALISGMVIFSA